MDVSKLSKKDKLAMLDMLEAKKRKAQSRRDVYQPHKSQLVVHKSIKHLRYVAAANGWGKTAFSVNEAIARCRGVNPWTDTNTHVPARVIVLLDQPMKVEATWIPELQKWIDWSTVKTDKKGKPYISQIQFPNGSEIMFFFHDQETMVFESIEFDMLICDEPPPRHAFIALMRGARKKNVKPSFLIVGTPISQPWLRTEIYEPWAKGERPDVDFFRGSTVENEQNLGEGYIANYSAFLTEKEKRIRLAGEFFDLDDLALAHLFDRNVHIIDSSKFRWPPQWPVVIAIDPAMAKPHAAVMVGATKDDQLVVLKELRQKGTAPEFAKHLKEMMAGYRVVDIVVDSMGSGDLTGGDGMLSFIESLKRNGIRCRATSYAEKQDEAWLSMIREVLHIPLEANNMGQRIPKLRVLDECKGLVSDIETVSWYRVKHGEDLLKPKLDITKKDLLACLKYALAAQPNFNKGNERIIRSPGGAGIRQRDKTFRR